MLSLAMFFDLADLLAQPVGEGLLQFQLRATVVEVVDRRTFVSERDESARRNLVAKPSGNKPISGVR